MMRKNRTIVLAVVAGVGLCIYCLSSVYPGRVTAGFMGTPVNYPQATQPIHFDRADFFMIIDWNGIETKTMYRAAFATKNCVAQLNLWENENWFRRQCLRKAIIAEKEVASLEQVVSKKPFILREGSYERWEKQQYLLRIRSGGRRFYSELGFSRKTTGTFLELVKQALFPQSKDPVDKIVEATQRWKDDR
jgi:hypothetical protein